LEDHHLSSKYQSFDLATLHDAIALIGGLLFAAGFFFDVFGYANYDGMMPFG
jgi:hypothetical protein